jgi:ABC-type methionine transport system permease subunit
MHILGLMVVIIIGANVGYLIYRHRIDGVTKKEVIKTLVGTVVTVALAIGFVLGGIALIAWVLSDPGA